MVPAMQRSGAAQERIVVLPKGIDLERYFYTDHFSSNKPFEFRAIVTRALASDYRHHIIIEAVAELKKSGINMQVDIAGDGPLKEYLKSLCISLGVSDLVNFIGRIPNNELPTYLARCPIYISTPITEGASSSLMEAMASGCFPIVTDLPGNRSFINNGENGVLVKVDSVESLVNSLLHIKLNRELAERAVRFNRNYAEKNLNRKLNMELFFKKYMNLLEIKLK
jgi:glycosyltransferase involved in cell wall biosynthesis